MAKYELTVVKEVKREFNETYKSYYQSIINLLMDYKSKGARLTIGTKHIRVFDSQNKLELHTETPPNLKDFKNFCETKGYRFIKK